MKDTTPKSDSSSPENAVKTFVEDNFIPAPLSLDSFVSRADSLRCTAPSETVAKIMPTIASEDSNLLFRYGIDVTDIDSSIETLYPDTDTRNKAIYLFNLWFEQIDVVLQNRPPPLKDLEHAIVELAKVLRGEVKVTT